MVFKTFGKVSCRLEQGGRITYQQPAILYLKNTESRLSVEDNVED